jgi:hypothetical protein
MSSHRIAAVTAIASALVALGVVALGVALVAGVLACPIVPTSSSSSTVVRIVVTTASVAARLAAARARLAIVSNAALLRRFIATTDARAAHSRANKRIASHRVGRVAGVWGGTRRVMIQGCEETSCERTM